MEMDMELLLSMSHRLTMDMAITPPITPMVTTFTRGLLMLSQVTAMVMLLATTTEAPRVCTDIMVVMDMAVMDMVMARGLLSQDIMAMEVMAMELEVTSRSAGHTSTMVSVLPTLTKCQMEIVHRYSFRKPINMKS